MSTRKAPPNWQHGFRLQDDPTFDSDADRQLTLFDRARVLAEAIPGVVVAHDLDTLPGGRQRYFPAAVPGVPVPVVHR